MCSIPGLPSPGSDVTVLIARVNLNPLCVLVEFWGNFVQDQKLAYQQMKKEIQFPREVFREGEGKPGDLCLVRVYETWYRARVVSRNHAHYDVYLIDEGRTLQAHVSLLAWGQMDFFNLPPEVEFCILSNVLPFSADNRWSKMALGFMKSLCGRTVTACVLDFSVAQRAFILDIPCLSRQMLEMGFAKKLLNEEFKDFVSRSLQSASRSVEPLRTACMTYEPVKQIKTQLTYMYPEIQAETTETVLVTEVSNPQRVFCQLKVFSHELKKLTEQITQHYERTTGSHFAIPENLGAACASRGTDGKWYRSVLQQVRSANNVVEVLHVDYGKKQFVQVDHVRPLAPEFIRMPVVTYVCSLHGVIDRGVGWTAAQIDYLRSLLLNRTLIAKFEYRSPSEGVHYVTLFGDENTNINMLFGSEEKCLIDSGCLDDYTVQMFGTSERQGCQISVKAEAQGSEDLMGILTESLSPNSDHVAVVQHVDSPSKFWIQTQKYAAEFDLLMNGLTELYSNLSRGSGLIRKPAAGLLCAAKAKDDEYYRAAVCEVIDTKAMVFFLDYGNKELVDCSSLLELPLEYQSLPPLAIKCSLYGIQPRSEEWDLNATLFFAEAVLDRLLDVHVFAKSQDTHLVQVIDSMSDGEKDLSKLLCNAGFAEFEAMAKPLIMPYPKVVQSSDVPKMSAASLSSSLRAAPPTFQEHLFPIGSSFDVIVSYIDSPNDFWCQKATEAKCLKFLMQDLQSYYANSEFKSPVEAACVARHPENRLWSRALIIQKNQNSNVTALFVDYGETKRVPIHDLRRIDPVFLKMKGQAFRCCLHNLSYPFSNSALVWNPDAELQFREFVSEAASMGVVLKCTVYAVMCNAQKVVYNVVDLESPFQSICRLLGRTGLVDHGSEKEALPPLTLDTYYYSSHGIKSGSEEDVCITYVENVNHFFCHLQRNSVQIDELADKVNRFCLSHLQRIKGSEISGKVCFAKYTDGLWYRGQFVSKFTKPSAVVHFVDYGNTLQVQEADILPIPVEAAEIMAIPVQAVKCRLSDVPEKVPSELNTWFETFAVDQQLKALIVAKEPSGKLTVELYDGKTPVYAIIREKFHLAIERHKQITVNRRDAKDHYRSHAAYEGRKDPQFLNGGMKKQHISHGESLGESVKAKLQVLKEADLSSKVVEPGLEAEVFISHCNSPLSFFVQFVTNEGDISSLVESLNDGQSEHIPVNPCDLCEGDLVCAEYPDDGCWYRAVVRKALFTGVAGVEFIDFGNTAEVSVSKICILDRMFSQPRYSIHCSLTGVSDVHCDVASGIKTKMEKKDGVLCKFIQQSGSVWEVSLEAEGELLGSAVSKDRNIVTVPGTPKSQGTDINLCTYKNPDISTGQRINVYASIIVGPQLFWCQYAEAEKLQGISGIIQKIGSNLQSEPLNQETLPIGSACIALFDEDQLWYRAKVTSVDKDVLAVLFVDYGNESKVKMNDVRPLPYEVSDLPPQAFACRLDGFNVLEGSWDDKAADQFFELVNDQLLNVTVVKCDMASPYFVKLEREELVINDAMQKCWMQNSKRTSLEPAIAPSATSPDLTTMTETFCVCEGEPSDATLAENEKPAAYTESPDNGNAVAEIISQEDHDLTGIGMPENTVESASVTDTNEDQDNSDVHSNLPTVRLGERLLDSTDFVHKGALTSSLEYTDENQVEIIEDSPEDQSCDEVCEKLHGLVSEQDEEEVITSDVGNIRRVAKRAVVGSECMIWSHAHKSWCRARTLKVTDESVLVLLLEHDFQMIVDPVNIFEMLPAESVQAEKEVEHEDVTCLASQDRSASSELDRNEVDEPGTGMDSALSEEQAQDEERDSCLVDLEEYEKTLQVDANQCADLDLETPQEMSQNFDDDVSLEQSDPGMEMDPKLESAQNTYSAMKSQVQAEETGRPVEEQEEHVTCERMDHLIDPRPPIALEQDQAVVSETESDPDVFGVMLEHQAEEAVCNTLECVSSKDPSGSSEEKDEQPSADVKFVIIDEQPQEKECDSCLDILVAESEKPVQEDATQGPDVGFDALQETSKMFAADVSVEQSEAEMEMNLCCAVDIQVQIMDDTQETCSPTEEQEEYATGTCEQVDELMDFIPAVPLEKVQALEVKPDAAVIELVDVIIDSVASDPGSVSLTDRINRVESELAEDSVSSDLQEPSDAEELTASAITHLSLRIEDASDDDIVFVKEWQVSPAEVNEPSSEE